MPQILLVTSSSRGPISYSRKVARSLADELAAGHPRARIVVRDLASEPLPHIGLLRFIGITDIETLAMEGMALDPEAAEKARN